MSIICWHSFLSTMMARLALPFHADSASGALAVSAPEESEPPPPPPALKPLSSSTSAALRSATTQPKRQAVTCSSSAASLMTGREAVASLSGYREREAVERH